jgi:hypothetical protein
MRVCAAAGLASLRFRSRREARSLRSMFTEEAQNATSPSRRAREAAPSPGATSGSFIQKTLLSGGAARLPSGTSAACALTRGGRMSRFARTLDRANRRVLSKTRQDSRWPRNVEAVCGVRPTEGHLRTVPAIPAVAISVAAGCSGSPDTSPSPSTSPSPPSGQAIDASVAKAPRPCKPREVNSLVADFSRAFNAGDLARLDLLFAPADSFQWYSTTGPGERFDPEASDRRTLVQYFQRRHARGEGLRLQSFRFNGNGFGFGHFEYGLVRSAEDMAPSPYYGKGAAICTRDRNVIAVWSMGEEAH